MKLYLARHGRTNYNDLNLCNGDPSVDVYITEVGEQQAELLADKLKEKPYENVLIITSGWIIHAATDIIKNMPNEEAWNLDVTQGDYLEMEI